MRSSKLGTKARGTCHLFKRDKSHPNYRLVQILRNRCSSYLKQEGDAVSIYREETVLKDLVFLLGRAVDDVKGTERFSGSRQGWIKFFLHLLSVTEGEFSDEERAEAIDLLTKEDKKIERKSW